MRSRKRRGFEPRSCHFPFSFCLLDFFSLRIRSFAILGRGYYIYSYCCSLFVSFYYIKLDSPPSGPTMRCQQDRYVIKLRKLLPVQLS
ncbi:uncharacterized protein BO96DRAFT_3000 [Aspergillus niger CBS 101883]|uniref:uncharacterized protein n=1 Tax=Aspergillus lacticoffeatus (strain CBS 101883) TaxID=1450533 RepID=UPI000D7F0035|nr:uncharacterized protein BO96DRAFT_3000 [Aspergillus niger CBS 101883]PYH61822.1 hypothetical protein BO96DRAFT_3000 [Aspergillus niger CBS 101883]